MNQQFFEALDHLPTTRIRVLVTIILISATGVIYLMHSCDFRDPVTQMCLGWEPSTNWLVFLSALAGVDVTQYFAKSFTSVQQSKVAATVTNTTTNANQKTDQAIVEHNVGPEDGVTSTSDVSELNREDELKG
jgi:hypothetical protein